MIVSEDGTVTGSIDVSKLDEVEAKTDEAKAQIEALKADAKVGQEQAEADAERLAKLHETQSAPGQAREAVTTQGDKWGDPNRTANPAAKPADQSAAKSADQAGEKASARKPASSSGKE